MDQKEFGFYWSESSQEDSSFTEKELNVENPNENSDLIRSNNDSNVGQLKINP